MTRFASTQEEHEIFELGDLRGRFGGRAGWACGGGSCINVSSPIPKGGRGKLGDLFPLARLWGLDADAEIESVVEISDDQPKAYMEGEGVYVRLICTAEEYRPLR